MSLSRTFLSRGVALIFIGALAVGCAGQDPDNDDIDRGVGGAGAGGMAGEGGAGGAGNRAGGGQFDCIDNDRDGYGRGPGCLGPDCDDNDNRVNPVAVEQCNGVDDDCNGVTDDNLIAPDCAQQFGVCAGARKTCGGAEGWLDCSGPASYGPQYEGGSESLCDGLDNNCDGRTDEGCPCNPGQSRPCGQAEGECRQGVQNCSDGGTWGACESEVGPQNEVCDGRDNDCDGNIDEEVGAMAPDCERTAGVCAGASARCLGQQGWGACGAQEYGETWRAEEGPGDCDGLDNDCDGNTDESCNCQDGETQPCGSNIGLCTPGTQTCVNGAFGECRNAVEAAPEVCNGADDDCDSNVDEGVEAPACALNQGVCAGAVQACNGEAGFAECDAARYLAQSPAYVEVETAEHCDGLDNDCDGLQDEECECVDGATQVCGVNVGACTQGEQVCAGGRFGECSGVAPVAETCDAVDNDCDGNVDEEIETPVCPLDQGVCAGARQRCVDGAFGACGEQEYGPQYEADEASCDAVDNDCDGEVDEGCGCVDGTVQSCGSNEGACSQGTQTCAGGEFQPCEGAIDPVDEQCNGLDDDCDGNTDEDLVGPACALQVGVCAGSVQVCGGEGGFAACGAEQYGPRYVAEETDADCDGADNDCDGNIDESCECVVGQPQPACGTNVGACESGVLVCNNGVFGECEGEVPPVAELCDGVDNDCDGSTDEDIQAPACALQVGVCAGSVQQCAGDLGFVECVNEEYGPNWVAEETADNCDGLDNDCDLLVDEACAPPAVVISEIYYDGPGRDGPNEFIELAGPPGQRLNGMKLTAWNGNNGEEYAEISLDGLRIPFNGFLLLVDENASEIMTDLADAVLPNVDLQNGPDSLWLTWNEDELLDAVGYGVFGEEDNFLGEGTPAPAAVEQSITRDDNLTDSDDNGADFVTSGNTAVGVPTPGGAPIPRMHISLRWGLDGTDVDLHLIREGGLFFSVPDDAFYANRTPDWGVLGDASDNPRLDRDDVDGLGPEFMFYQNPVPGRYRVVIHYWDAFIDAMTAGPVDATVKVFIDGEPTLTLTNTVTGELPYWGVAEIAVGEDGMIMVTEENVISADILEGPQP
ncbi:MAG: MopE-related protein [Bradymonadia bacterium]